jgi:hypothetical protein
MSVNLSNHFCSVAQVEKILSMISAGGVSYVALVSDACTIFRLPSHIVKNTCELLDSSNVISINNSIVTKHSLDYQSKVSDYVFKNELLILVLQAFSIPNDGLLSLDIYRLPKSCRYFHQVLFIAGIASYSASNPSRYIAIEKKYLEHVSYSIKINNKIDWVNKVVITPDQLELINKRKAELGYQAELWVLEREKRRLKNHLLFDAIKMVSTENVAAGFDIASYSSNHSMTYDKLIEVKSYSGQPKIYITKNELDAANYYAEKYFLVIVDRDKLGDSEYSPREYGNPYQMLFSESRPDWVSVNPTTYEVLFDF